MGVDGPADSALLSVQLALSIIGDSVILSSAVTTIISGI